MRIPRIYIDDATLHQGKSITLNARNSHYINRVLRLKTERPLRIFDGKTAGYFEASLTHSDKRASEIHIGKYIENVSVESNIHIHLGIVLSKANKMDGIIQKCTELGVSAITPLTSERCDIKLTGDKEEKKIQHWQEVIINACEQCEKNILPSLNNITSLTEWCNTQSKTDIKWVMDCHNNQNSTNQSNEVRSAAVLIGPEGGLTENEINTAHDQGFNSIQLGHRILRTETTPLVAISLLQAKYGDFTI